MPGIHHVEVWVSPLDVALSEWGWLLRRAGFTLKAEWAEGQSWDVGGSALVLTTSPNLKDDPHDRRRPGVNHIAFAVGARETVDAIMSDAPKHGWTPLYHDRYPHAGGRDHYAGWVENSSGFKVELVADAV
ncbi:catechol 2,3-dioxygenase-like lactoylglutathione lyase family enzyme [Microbacterium resistens]|uniref:Catechol 2,3-dioxygenase-like lactoylglutathione lyase family enzyme n=1 Tax=Microbacterium resistens TaxID=156977 RepID=A0ABU1SEH0_9MICO|nr:VOC family protein [Microbacterium resistens]MDR6867964.1 catechol 2,3-dioxygenase-like lactoylglutathione lyase family enzyme [Microbacterium resistens]